MALATAVELVDFYLGLLVSAGDYALTIQPRIAGPDQKDGHNAWVSALTDADLSVQNFIEVATLARFPDVAFFGEEHSESLNKKYFPTEAPVSVHLDPINGTYLFKHQRPNWDIIISIAEQRRLVAAISYVPSSGRFYLGLRKGGALTGQRSQPRLADMVPLHTRPGGR